MFRPFAAFGGGVFEQHYRCYPVSFIDKIDSEDGGKIFLPPSALDRLGKKLPLRCSADQTIWAGDGFSTIR